MQKMNNRIQIIKYLSFDLVAATLTWCLFYLFRKYYIEHIQLGYDISSLLDHKFYLGLITIPLFWIVLYYITGNYRNAYRKARLQELGNTFLISFIGVLIIFFVSILDDIIFSYKSYYLSFIVLFSLQFFLTYIPRLIITSQTIHKLRSGKISFRTIIVGGNEKALDLFKSLTSHPKSAGNKFIGFVSVKEQSKYTMNGYLKNMGNYSNLKDIVLQHSIDEVIIAIEYSEHKEIGKIINNLLNSQVIIKAIPDTYDILSGTVQLSSLYSPPLVQIKHELMPAWQENTKQLIDVVFSVMSIILLLPVYVCLAFAVKLSSKGPILYTHQRIGKYGKPFNIYKFRSMYIDAEKNGPQLSSESDKRITKIGRFLRKTRLDEIPQFYNVIKGDMSIVGPRPERQYYIDKIIKTAPYYTHLFKVRPGITSWGQVKYGYAENVDQMIERLKFDLIYIENMSLYVDFKIMIYTIKTITEVSGK